MNGLAGSLDTNVLLRLILQDVPDQHEAVVELFYRSKGQLAIADLAVTEMVFVLAGPTYQFSRQQIAEAIEGLMNVPKINCNRALFRKVLPMFTERPALSFEDCCLAVYAELNDAQPLWTFDQKLAKQAPSAQLVTIVD